MQLTPTMIHRRSLKATFAVLLLASTALAGCAKKEQPPIATETQAQMQQRLQQNADKYRAFRQSHPNAYQPGTH